ncbi:hypothetical protein HDV00_010753 [Rhizophlyctis rosea]|nr:hypothetical protein HDV00_010753 [Rhizophlyctis rosea]
MVKFFATTSTFPYSWDNVSLAVWKKYPNPFASHVLSADVIDREVDPVTGVMTTTRLFLKEGNLPKWGLALLHVPEAFIIEQSTVDPVNRTMTTTTRNLSHRKLMLVEETQVFRQHPEKDGWTEMHTEARIVSNTRMALMRGKIEGFGLKKFKDNTLRSSKGLLHVVESLAQSVRDVRS